VSKRLQKSTNDAQASRGAVPWQGSARTGAQPRTVSARGPGEAQRASRAGGRGSKATTPAKARAGHPNRVSRGKGLRSIEGTPVSLSAHLVHAGGLGATSAALERALGARAPGAFEREATRVSEARPHARRREDNARRRDPSRGVRPAEARLHCREAGNDSRLSASEQSLDDPLETDETRVPVRRIVNGRSRSDTSWRSRTRRVERRGGHRGR
jgi:hypothetical protein